MASLAQRRQLRQMEQKRHYRKALKLMAQIFFHASPLMRWITMNGKNLHLLKRSRRMQNRRRWR